MSTPRPVRVRVAPSPTGDPHVGTAYIALFNYAFARCSGGKFLLRIEDTDRERSTKESEQAIFESLRWVGLAWDEGPDVGGPFGPYRQSERADIYRKHAADLVASGAAYRCFCTAERLTALREEQKAKKLNIGYDGACRSLSPDDVRAKLDAGVPHVVRLAVPREGQTVVYDLVRGEVVIQNAAVDDQVLIKSDGFPTYHLANVVDDRLMGITHVIRAEEWITSTPKHLLLYKAFGWEPPVFCHMPLLRNKDKSKISKRKNPTSLLWYRAQGYLPEALLNFLALMGWSVAEGKEVFPLDAMVREFTLDRVATSEPIFDFQKLDWLNGLYIRALPPAELARRLRDFMPQGRPYDEAFVLKTVPLVQERLKKLGDYAALSEFLYADAVNPSLAELVPKKSTPEQAAAMLAAAAQELAAAPDWSAKPMEELCRAAATGIGAKDRDLFMCLRVAVTGAPVSPPLFESMAVLGRDKCLARITAAQARLRNG
jgi:glutamyl-tRNA synthetase